MSSASSEKLSVVPARTPVQTRKPYHTPRLENYGVVSELTRSGGPVPVGDGVSGYYTYSSGN